MCTNLLIISLDFNYTCGVSKHVYNNLKLFSNQNAFKQYFITNGGDSLDRLNQIKNLKITIFNFKKDHKNIFYLVRDSIRLYIYCKKKKIDIIHTHHRYAELLSVIVSKVYKLKTISTVHSFVEGQNTLSFRSDKIICVSNSVKQHIIKNYSQSKNKLKVIYNCIEDDFIASAQNYSTNSQKGIINEIFSILFIGRNNPIKGFDILIKSLQKLSILYNLNLIVIGYEKKVALEYQTIYSDNIEFVGVQSNLIKYYHECDLVVIPSRKDPFPYVMLEAAVMKKPIVATDTGGLREFISDGYEGSLFKVEDENDLSDKIEFVINNYDKAIAMANKLFEKVITKYRCEPYFNNLLKMYYELSNLNLKE